jgi:DNA repair photolyase
MKRKTGTREWADKTCNIQVGCEHDCLYCYAKSMAIRFKRATVDGWKVPGMVNVRLLPVPKRPGVVMFPSTHDVTFANALSCGRQVHCLLQGGDDVLLVTKARQIPLTQALGSIVGTVWQRRVEVRVTIGSLDSEVLKFWEPGAPDFYERVAALKWAKEQGFRTSVSMEPMLDSCPESVVEIVKELVTDGVWLGKAKNLVQRVMMNTGGDPVALHAAHRLNELWSDKRLVRRWECHWKYIPMLKIKDSVREVVERVTGQVL